MNVLVLGATGATGKDLLTLLLNDDTVKRIDIFVRREINLQHQKLNTHIIDFDKPEHWKHLVTGDVLFSCLGTTLKDAGSKAKQWKVDYEYQYQFAKAAKDNNVNSYLLVSSGMASKNSLFYYTRMKGQLEEDVKALSFQRLVIFNPSVLIREGSSRTGEKMIANVFAFFNALGLLKSVKPMKTSILAQAMLNASKNLPDGEHVIKGEQIRNFTAI